MIDLDLSGYKDLLFKSKNDPKVKELLDLLGINFRYSEFPDVYYQIYEELGIELVFSKEHYFKRFIIYNGFQDKVKAVLPYELKFSYLMKEVEKYLGFPEQSGGGSKTMNYWVNYPELGIGVDYKTNNKNDLEAKIDRISFNYPQSSETRIAFQNRSEMVIYFQIRSKMYSPDLIGDLLKLLPDRVDIDDLNLFEVLITKNPHFSTKAQLRELFRFLTTNEQNLINYARDIELTVKFGIYSHLSNSFKLQIPCEILSIMGKMDSQAEFDFMT